MFMEMRSWPQPVKDRESVLLRRAVSRHTPRRMATDRCTCFGKRIWSDHLTLLPILSVSLAPLYSLLDQTRSKLARSSRKNYLSNWTSLRVNDFLPSFSSTRIQFSLAEEECATSEFDPRTSVPACPAGGYTLLERCTRGTRVLALWRLVERRERVVIFYNVSFGTRRASLIGDSIKLEKKSFLTNEPDRICKRLLQQWTIVPRRGTDI